MFNILPGNLRDLHVEVDAEVFKKRLDRFLLFYLKCRMNPGEERWVVRSEVKKMSDEGKRGVLSPCGAKN